MVCMCNCFWIKLNVLYYIGKGIPVRQVLGKSKMLLGMVEGLPTMLKGEVAMVSLDFTFGIGYRLVFSFNIVLSVVVIRLLVFDLAGEFRKLVMFLL